MRVDDTWYGWIPTNLGKIVFDFIDGKNLSFLSKKYKFKKENNEITISLFDIYFISGTSFFNRLFYFFKNKEYYSNANILIQNKISSLDGSIKFFYKDTITFEVSFSVETNGKAKFKLEKIDNPHNIYIDNISYEIKQIIYVILKGIIHGDNHYHQKIDTVLKITEDSFDTEKILDYNMLLHLKMIERNIKMSKEKCSYRLKQNITVDEVNGYISYIKTFVVLFGNDYMKEKLKIANNIKDSLNANISRREKKFNYIDKNKTILLTIFALIIATNILFNSTFDFKHPTLNIGDRFIVFVYTIIFWFLIYMDVISCNLESSFSISHYRSYRFLKALKDFLRNILISILIIFGILLIIYGFSYKN